MSKIFIHIPKNGGMTIRHGLRGKIDEVGKERLHPFYVSSLLQTMARLGDHHGIQHARWRDLVKVPKGKCFAVVRNPWSRTVSRYLFAKKVIEVEKKVPKDYADVRSFEHFLEERHKWGGELFMWHRAVRGWYPQKDYVVDDCGKLQCDILRLEHLEEDLMAYGKWAFPRKRNVTAMTEKPYQNFYDDNSFFIVEEWYKEDIDFFGFSFDSSATKNIFAQ